jgi:hypothetical protein
LVTWSKRQASVLPAAVVLNATVVLNAAQAVLQAAAFWYWAAIATPATVRGLSSEPQAAISMLQKLSQTPPATPALTVQYAGAAPIVSPPGPA